MGVWGRARWCGEWAGPDESVRGSPLEEVALEMSQ